jgi:hypothetical protein
MDERDQAAEADARESGALLFIGLIVLLIGFFVVLTHASRIENARSRAVMGSVAATFAPARADADADAQHAFTDDLGNVLQNGSLTRRLGTLVATDFPLAKVSEKTPGQVYEVELPVTSMWIGGATDPSAAGRRFIAEVASLLAAPPEGSVYRLDAWLASGQGAERDRAVRRVTTLADALVAAGAPRVVVDSGLAHGRKIMLRLIFTAHQAEAAR